MGGRIGGKSIGLFAYNKTLDANGIRVSCEVRVFPLLVKRQSKAWPEIDSGWFSGSLPTRALALVKDDGLKGLVAAFAKRVAVAASKSTP